MGRNGRAVRGESIISRVNSGIADENTLGVQSYWTLYNNRVDTDAFVDAMGRHNIPAGLFRHQTDRSRFLETVQAVAKSYGTVAKKILQNDGRIVVKIIQEIADVDENDVCNSKFEYHQDTTIVFNEKDGHPTVSGSGVVEIIDDVIARFNEYRNKTSVDFVRLTFIDVLRAYGSIPLRGSGGIYFMPFDRKRLVDAISSLTEEFGLGTVYQIRMPKGANEKTALMAGVENELKQRLKFYSEKIDKINKTSTLYKKKGEVKREVAEIFELYSDVLAEATEVEEREAEKKAMFKELREAYAKYEILLEERMQELES